MTIFKTILNMSFSATVVIFIVMIVRALLKRQLSKSFAYGLWALVLLRLLLPVSFESEFSIFNFIDMSRFTENTSSTEDSLLIENALLNESSLFVENEVDNQGNLNEASRVNSEVSSDNQLVDNSNLGKESSNNSVLDNQISEENEPTVSVGNDGQLLTDNQTGDNLMEEDQRLQKVESIEDISIGSSWLDINSFQVAGIMWLIGLGAVILFFFFNYIRFYRLLADATIYKVDAPVRVFVSDKIESPMIQGFIYPRIILPSYYRFNEEELNYVLAHEIAHLKRLDHLVKPFALVLVCIHWFNPFVWIAFFLAMKDMELSCDEKVLKQYDEKHQTNYAKTLLNISINQNHRHLNPMVAFGEKNTKERIKSAASFKNISMKVRIIGVLILSVLIVVLVSDASNKTKAEQDKKIETNVDGINNGANDEILDDMNSGDTDNDVVDDIDVEPIEEVINGEDTSVIEESIQYTYRQLKDLAETNNFEKAVVYAEMDDEIVVLVYNSEFTEGALLYTDQDLKVNRVEAFEPNNSFAGYDFYCKYGDFRNQTYILGVMIQRNEEGLGESKLVCIPKDNLSELYVIGEYTMPYQSQGDIPTIIDFTVTLSGEFVSYCDVDTYFKVQEIKTGEVFTSNENTTRVAEAIPVDLINEPIEQLMPIVDYQDNSEYLYFNRVSKEFILGIKVADAANVENELDIENLIKRTSLSEKINPLNNYLEEQDIYFENFFVTRKSIIVFYENSKVLSYDLETEKIVNIDLEGSNYVNTVNVKRLDNGLLAIINKNRIILYDELEKQIEVLKEFDEEQINAFDLSKDGREIVYMTRDDELFIEDLYEKTTTQIEYKSDFDTTVRGIQPVYSNTDDSIAFIIIGNREGQTIAVIDSNREIKYNHLLDSLGHSSTIEWLRDGTIAYINDYSILFLEAENWEVYKEIERFEESEIDPTVSFGDRYLLYENGTGEIESFDCITEETEVVINEVTQSQYQLAELTQTVVGTIENKRFVVYEK